MKPVLLAALLIPAAALAAQQPAEAARQLVAAFEKVKTGAPATQNAAAYAELDRMIDFETISSRVIEPRAEKLSAAQKSEFHANFRELIRLIAYPDTGEFFRRAKLAWKPSKSAGAQTIVALDVRVPAEDLETEIALHYEARGKDVKLVDVSFDGDSLVRDYQSQIARIIDKDGARGLLQKLQDRRRAVESGSGSK